MVRILPSASVCAHRDAGKHFTRGIFCAALLITAASPASAAIHRCVGAGGTDVYTDRTCASLDLPARDMRGTTSPDSSDLARPSWKIPRGLVAGCPAATAEALIAGVETGLARRDVNYLSGFFLWTGVGSQYGREITARLRRLMDRDLLEIRLLPDDNPDQFAAAPPDWDPYFDPAPPRPSPTGLAIRHSARGDEYGAGEETRLSIRRQNECLWLAF